MKEKITDTKELTCNNCSKLVNITQLKAIPGGKWVCKECSYNLFGRMTIRKPRPISVPESKENIHHFDPFKEEENMQYSFIKTQKQNISEKKLQTISNKKLSTKIPYKCSFCKYESRQHKGNAFCPNCGKKGGLVKISSTAEILKNIDKEQFF